MNITDIRTIFVNIKPKVYKVKDNIISRTLEDNGGDWCFINSLDIKITDFALVNNPSNILIYNIVILFKDMNIGLRDSWSVCVYMCLYLISGG